MLVFQRPNAYQRNFILNNNPIERFVPTPIVNSVFHSKGETREF